MIKKYFTIKNEIIEIFKMFWSVFSNKNKLKIKIRTLCYIVLLRIHFI